ncbi:hypothetical protein HK101_001457 [Irineochytrium annulatum]|nr:hypothetical protein HK101_001457 [Irineochytrium annulatum]
MSAKDRIIPSGLGGFNMAWLPLQQALEKCIYKNIQDALRQAYAFIEEEKLKAPPPQLNMREQGYNDGSRRPTALLTNGGSDRRTATGEATRRRLNVDGERPATSQNGNGHPNGINPGKMAGGGLRKDGNPAKPGVGMQGQTKKMIFAPNGTRSWRSAEPDGIAKAEAEEAEALAAAGAAKETENPLYKTRLCERFETEGTCPYGVRCTFAHGTAELRDRATFGGEVETPSAAVAKEGPENPLYKTRMCERFQKEKFCQYGPRCNFAHSVEELRVRPPTTAATFADDERAPFSGHSNAPPAKNEVHEKEKVVVTEVSNSHVIPGSVKANVVKAPKNNESISLKEIMDDREKTRRDKNPKVVEVAAALAAPRVLANMPLLAANPGANTVDSKQPAPKALTDARAAQALKLEETLIAHLKNYFNSARSPRGVQEETKEITRLEFKHDLGKQQLFTVLIGSLFGADYAPGKLQARVALLQRFIRTREDQKLMLRGFEKAMVRDDGLERKAALVFKNLYDKDLMDEEVFVDWFEGGIPDGLKKRCNPLIEWFKNAEEEE